MTVGSLRLEIPTLVPDEAFVRRLADLAAASKASPGVVVPAAFGGPAKAVAAAAAVAAITAGGAAAASRISHSHHQSPTPPFSTHDTHSPHSASRAPGRGHTQDAEASTGGQGPGHSVPVGTQPSATHGGTPPPAQPTPSGPETHDPTQDSGDDGGHDGDHGSTDGGGRAAGTTAVVIPAEAATAEAPTTAAPRADPVRTRRRRAPTRTVSRPAC